MPATPIGDNLILYWDGVRRSDYLLISAHGATVTRRPHPFARSIDATFTVPPGITLYYYGPAGHILKMAPKYRLGHAVVETCWPGSQSIDYELSTYQGRENNGAGETSESILDQIADVRRRMTLGVPAFEEFIREGGYPRDDEDTLRFFKDAKHRAHNLLPMDILGITKRMRRGVSFRGGAPHWSGINLSTVLRILQTTNHNYQHIFCSFCRSYASTSPSHAPVQY